MNTVKPLKIWLIGGSQGIGLELCKNLLELGHTVLVSARTAENNPDLIYLQQHYKSTLRLMNLDVIKDNVRHEVASAWHQLNGIDTWFYNAGTYQPMKIEQWNYEKFAQMMNVNYLGCVKLMIALKPFFLKQQTGNWIWNISLSSDFGLPYGGAYSAPKAALMNLAESLQPELALHNIELQVINHGFVKTRLTAKNDFAMLGLMTTEQAAQAITKTLSHNKFETRFPFNLASLLRFIKTIPKSWALKITKKALKDE